MTRRIKTLGLMGAAVLVIAVVAASSASAASFTAGAAPEEKAKIDIEQIGSGETFTLNGLKLTCTTVTMSGEALEKGSSFAEATVTPSYGSCHIIVAGLTKLVTVVVNGCTYRLKAASSSTASVEIECPEGKQIEIHIYNQKEKEEIVLCNWDIESQTASGTIGLTNNAKTPSSADDLNGVPKLETKVHNTIMSSVCGPKETETGVYSGENTLRATATAYVAVDTSIS